MGDGGRILEREEGIGKVVELVDNAGVVSAGCKYKVRAIMGERGGDVKTPNAVFRPGRSSVRGEMGNGELACRVDGMGGKVERLSVDAVPGGEEGIGAVGSQVIEGELSEREEIRPAVRGEREVSGRQDSDEMILRCPDRPLGWVSTMLVWRDKLVLDELGSEELG